MRIKICGITRKEDAMLAAELGAWAVGFIFVENTPRYISPEIASEIICKLPENLNKIGVFANMSAEGIKNIEKTGITKIQLHGDETPEFCEKLKASSEKEIIKAFRIKNIQDLEIIKLYKEKISYILLDSFSENQLGGTGKSFDLEIAKKAKNFGIPVILAGGLNPDNIKQAYETVKPYALDVSSGVESVKGIKDSEKLRKLFNLSPE